MRRKKKTRTKSKSTLNALGLFQVLLFTTFFYILNGVSSNPVETQSVSAQTVGLPFLPIGSDSAVDRYSQPGQYTETGYRNNAPVAEPRPSSGDPVTRRQVMASPTANGSYAPVRQVSMQSGGFSAPPTGAEMVPQGTQVPTQFAPPPLITPPQLSSQATQSPNTFVPPKQLATPPSDASPLAPPSINFNNSEPPAAGFQPRSLPNSTPTYTPSPPAYAGPPLADYEPITAPQLSNGGFATMADCRLITPPSSYTAMSPYGDACGNLAPTNYTNPYVPPPAQIPAPAVMPPMTVSPSVTTTTPILTPPPGANISPPAAAPVGSLVTFGQERLPVQVGQGLWGQPVAYVPGQRCRNWLRYLSF